jgi:FkbM family methyltransferase
MDIKSLKKNIFDSIYTTVGLYNALKKFLWLYDVRRKFGDSSPHEIKIRFKYPYPVGKIYLKVRYNRGSDSFILSEVFQNQCYRIPFNNDIIHILDLGANAGFTAVYFSKLFPKAQVACVEPMPNNISILKENLALNNVNAIIFDAAAAIEDENITMIVGDRDYGNKVYNISFGKQVNNNTLVVNGITINTIIKKLNWGKIDLLKIDIEGYEGILLNKNNDWLDKVHTIIMEIHEGVTIDFVKKITYPYGFKYIEHQKGNWILSKNEVF